MIKQSSRVKTDTHTAALAVSGQIQVSPVFPTSIDSGSVPDSSTGSLPYTGLGISFLNSNIYNKQNIIQLPKNSYNQFSATDNK